MLTSKEERLLRSINIRLNKTGEYPTYSELAEELGYKSKNSITVLVQNLIKKKELIKDRRGGFKIANPILIVPDQQTTIIPLIGEVACGAPIFAEENLIAQYSVSTKFVDKGSQYFLLRAIGDSMNSPKNNNESIFSGDLVLIKIQSTAENGDLVLAIIDGEATIKEYQKQKNHILLIPHSDNPIHKPMILGEDFIIQGIVRKVFNSLN